jgi:hypothetical protein
MVEFPCLSESECPGGLEKVHGLHESIVIGLLNPANQLDILESKGGHIPHDRQEICRYEPPGTV